MRRNILSMTLSPMISELLDCSAESQLISASARALNTSRSAAVGWKQSNPLRGRDRCACRCAHQADGEAREGKCIGQQTNRRPRRTLASASWFGSAAAGSSSQTTAIGRSQQLVRSSVVTSISVRSEFAFAVDEWRNWRSARAAMRLILRPNQRRFARYCGSDSRSIAGARRAVKRHFRDCRE